MFFDLPVGSRGTSFNALTKELIEITQCPRDFCYARLIAKHFSEPLALKRFEKMQGYPGYS